MKDGMIKIDSKEAKKLGFTSDKFTNYSYLWKIGDNIYISLIGSKKEGEGYLRGLFNEILESGFKVAVPNPLPKMEQILAKNDFVMEIEEDSQVWIKTN